MAQTINKPVLNQIILLQERLDTLAERLQKNKSLSKEYEQYQEFYISPQINRAVKNKSYFYNCYGKEEKFYIENQG